MRQPGVGIMPFATAVRTAMSLSTIQLTEQARFETTDISGDPAHGQA
jgi:hypothetical protein